MAKHHDLVMDEGLHEHVWVFTVFWPAEPWRDLRVMDLALATNLSPLQGTELPPELWSAEALAKRVFGSMANIVGVKVERPGIGGVGLGDWR